MTYIGISFFFELMSRVQYVGYIDDITYLPFILPYISCLVNDDIIWFWDADAATRKIITDNCLDAVKRIIKLQLINI